jgi:hypothetical protein
MMLWALIGLGIFFLLLTYIIVQGARAAIAWRTAAAKGDVDVIRLIVDDSISAWRSMKRPKPVPPEVWRGVQSLQCVEVGPDFVRVSCQAQAEYQMRDGKWAEVRNPLQEGFAIAARVAEMVFYDLPHFRPARVQVDVYTSFREGDSGFTQNVCILSVESDCGRAREVDWDEWTPEEIVDALGARYRLGERGQPLAIEVAPPAGEQAADSESKAAAGQ